MARCETSRTAATTTSPPPDTTPKWFGPSPTKWAAESPSAGTPRDSFSTTSATIALREYQKICLILANKLFAQIVKRSLLRNEN